MDIRANVPQSRSIFLTRESPALNNFHARSLVICILFFLAWPLAASADESAPAPTAAAESTPARPVTPASQPTPEPTPTEAGSGSGIAIFLGISPLNFPQISNSSRLNTGTIPAFDAGVELNQQVKVGLRYAKATVPSLEVYNPTTFLTSYDTNASLALYELYAGVDIPLNQPYGSLGRFQLFVPVNFGSVYAKASGGADSFSAVSIDTAAGIGARYYALSFLRVDLSALYHLGFPLSTFSGGSTAAPNTNLYDPASETLKAGLSGFELRMGIAFLTSPEGPK